MDAREEDLLRFLACILQEHDPATLDEIHDEARRLYAGFTDAELVSVGLLPRR